MLRTGGGTGNGSARAPSTQPPKAFDDWSDPRHTLASAFAVLRAPLGETLVQLSAVLADALPHRALIMLTGDCARSPLSSHGDPVVVEKVTSGELARLAGTFDVGTPYFGQAIVAEVSRPILALAANPTGSAGALLAVVLAEHTTPPRLTQELAQRLWDLITLHLADRSSAADPVPLAGNRAAAGERARVIGELTEAHSATLSALLGALRSRSLDDAAARRTATDLTAAALIELRAVSDRDRVLSEEPAGEAFHRLVDKLSPLTRYSDVALELIPPEDRRRSLPADIANTARAVVRGVVLTMLEQEGVNRIRAAWQVGDTELRVTLRDDGPGGLAAEALAVHRLTDRVKTLSGVLALDAVPGWGTTITVSLPLAPPSVPDRHPLAELNPREVEVLAQLTRGHRNGQIAEHLYISPHTVKFHVANILDKLAVGSRGEAAALAREAGLKHESDTRGSHGPERSD